MEQKKRGLPEVKQRNLVRIKEMIYKNAPITRIEIANALQLTLPTVTTGVSAMLSEGLLREQPQPEGAHGNPLGGRKPSLLDFNADAAYAIGAELGPYKTTLCIVNLRGDAVAEYAYDAAPADYDSMLSQLILYITEAAKAVPAQKLLGVGIGLPGFIDSKSGVIRGNPRAGWNQKAPALTLAKALQMPVFLENNVRLRAVGEALFSKAARPPLFAYYYISKGVACPLVINDDVMAGHTAGAGEIGHTMVKPGGPVCPTCGHLGCLDALSGETAIINACAKACNEERAPLLKALWRREGKLEMKTILQAQELGEPAVCEIMAEAVQYLGISLANVVNLISPGMVIVDGYIMKNQVNRQDLQEVAARHFYGLNAEEVHIDFLSFDLYRGAKGAAARVLRKELLEK